MLGSKRLGVTYVYNVLPRSSKYGKSHHFHIQRPWHYYSKAFLKYQTGNSQTTTAGIVNYFKTTAKGTFPSIVSRCPLPIMPSRAPCMVKGGWVEYQSMSRKQILYKTAFASATSRFDAIFKLSRWLLVPGPMQEQVGAWPGHWFFPHMIGSYQHSALTWLWMINGAHRAPLVKSSLNLNELFVNAPKVLHVQP